MKLLSPKDVLSYWYGVEYISNKMALSSRHYVERRLDQWYSGKDLDFIRVQYENVDLIDKVSQDYPITPDINENIDYNSDSWQSPAGLHAKVILFDQFPREAYRGTSKAFAYDFYSQKILSYVIEKNILLSNQYSYSEKFFFLHAYLHSEIKEHHVKLTELATKIVENESEDIINHHMTVAMPFFIDHSNVVLRFGRYPYRNDVLGRISTNEEEEWLNSPDLPQWAKSQSVK